jgi:UTP--glucose-1-phosphate uridylyltransferase
MPDMLISRAVITAAGAAQRGLPLQTLVDRDGITKTALQILIEEALSAGCDRVCVVVQPGDESGYATAAGDHASRLDFVNHDGQTGYGRALLAAADWAGDAPFLHLVGDHLCLSRVAQRCAAQLVAVAQAHDCSVSAVQPTRESQLHLFGAIGGKRFAGANGVYAIEQVLEKPTPTVAEQTLYVPGLRAGHYLCFFGLHVLTPGAVNALRDAVSASTSPRPTLADGLSRLIGSERYLAFEVDGTRYNIGARYGLLQAQLALALSGKDRAEVLAHVVEAVAH